MSENECGEGDFQHQGYYEGLHLLGRGLMDTIDNVSSGNNAAAAQQSGFDIFNTVVVQQLSSLRHQNDPEVLYSSDAVSVPEQDLTANISPPNTDATTYGTSTTARLHVLKEQLDFEARMSPLSGSGGGTALPVSGGGSGDCAFQNGGSPLLGMGAAKFTKSYRDVASANVSRRGAGNIEGLVGDGRQQRLSSSDSRSSSFYGGESVADEENLSLGSGSHAAKLIRLLTKDGAMKSGHHTTTQSNSLHKNATTETASEIGTTQQQRTASEENSNNTNTEANNNRGSLGKKKRNKGTEKGKKRRSGEPDQGTLNGGQLPGSGVTDYVQSPRFAVLNERRDGGNTSGPPSEARSVSRDTTSSSRSSNNQYFGVSSAGGVLNNQAHSLGKVPNSSREAAYINNDLSSSSPPVLLSGGKNVDGKWGDERKISLMTGAGSAGKKKKKGDPRSRGRRRDEPGKFDAVLVYIELIAMTVFNGFKCAVSFLTDLFRDLAESVSEIAMHYGKQLYQQGQSAVNQTRYWLTSICVRVREWCQARWASSHKEERVTTLPSTGERSGGWGKQLYQQGQSAVNQTRYWLTSICVRVREWCQARWASSHKEERVTTLPSTGERSGGWGKQLYQQGQSAVNQTRYWLTSICVRVREWCQARWASSHKEERVTTLPSTGERSGGWGKQLYQQGQSAVNQTRYWLTSICVRVREWCQARWASSHKEERVTTLPSTGERSGGWGKQLYQQGQSAVNQTRYWLTSICVRVREWCQARWASSHKEERVTTLPSTGERSGGWGKQLYQQGQSAVNQTRYWLTSICVRVREWCQARWASSHKEERVTTLPSTAEEAMRWLLGSKGKDAYSILGLTSACSDEEIKRNYRKLAVMVHPDKNTMAGADEAFKVLGHAFELIGTSERRTEYDSLHAKNAALKEFQELIEQLKESLNTMHCDCGQKHRRYDTKRDRNEARYCRKCATYHSVREGDIWAESHWMGFLWYYFACMGGRVYDITEWAGCQKNNLKHIKANTHVIQYRLITAGNRKPPGSTGNPKRNVTEAEIDAFMNHLCDLSRTASMSSPGTGNQSQTASGGGGGVGGSPGAQGGSEEQRGSAGSYPNPGWAGHAPDFQYNPPPADTNRPNKARQRRRKVPRV